MDLYAYSQIGEDKIEEIVKKNNIVVPRLRGYRLMSEQKKVTDYDSDVNEIYILENLLDACPTWSLNPFCWEFSSYKRYLEEKYIDYKNNKVRWELIHGKHRKNLKFAIKQKRKRVSKQYNTFNKYVGRDDVLMIHARIGGGNWPYYCKEVKDQPWFIEKVDDSFDRTYCDIYAKIER